MTAHDVRLCKSGTALGHFCRDVSPRAFDDMHVVQARARGARSAVQDRAVFCNRLALHHGLRNVSTRRVLHANVARAKVPTPKLLVPRLVRLPFYVLVIDELAITVALAMAS